MVKVFGLHMIVLRLGVTEELEKFMKEERLDFISHPSILNHYRGGEDE